MGPVTNTFLSLAICTLSPIAFILALSSRLPCQVQSILAAFAAGGVLSDVFLHLLPETMSEVCSPAPQVTIQNPAGHGHHHHHHSISSDDCDPHSERTHVGMLMLMGIIAFFLLEKLVGAMSGEHGCGHGGHTHRVSEVAAEEKADPRHVSEGSKSLTMLRKRNRNPNSEEDKITQVQHPHPTVDALHHDQNHSRHIVRGWLHMLATGAHCFAEGATLCLAFLSSPASGYSTSIAMFLHEVPHMLSDHAILRQNGFTKHGAIKLQFFGVLACFAGAASVAMVCGRGSASIIDASASSIMPFAAGGLTYLALVGIASDLLETPEGWAGVGDTVMQVGAIAAGVGLMSCFHDH